MLEQPQAPKRRAPRDPRPRIGISGSYGGFNLGDEAILAVIIDELRRSADVEITVFSRDAEDTRRRHRVDRAVAVREMSRREALHEIDRLDLFILGGGGILYDGEARIYLREVVLAQERGVPVMVYAISAGPLQDPGARDAVKQGLQRAVAVTVRERRALHVLEDAGVERDIKVTADPAVLLQPEPLPPGALEREAFDEGQRLIGMSVREPGIAAPDIDIHHYHGLLANAADYMVQRFDADVVFVPMERRMQDMRHSHAVIGQMAHPQRATVLRSEYTSGQLLTLVKHFAFCVGMRLHFLIFAALQGVPFVALPYASKVAGFLDDLQMEMPPMQEVNAGLLIAYIDHSWDFRAKIGARIGKLLPEIQERARQNNAIALQILANRAAGIDTSLPGGS